MQRSFLKALVCPACSGTLALEPMECEVDHVVEGALACGQCRTWYPVTHGVPVMLVYPTDATIRFEKRWKQAIQAAFPGYHVPQGQPAPGEEWVRRAFSTEWGEFEYDEALFSYSVEERAAILRAEVGPLRSDHRYELLADVGCGIGVTTDMAARQFGVVGVGMDLSSAVFQAAARFRNAPNLHFVQGSVFQLPLRRGAFDIVYSSGVLHHTFDTGKALSSAATLCRAGGRLAVWLYGIEATRNTLRRRVVHGLERALAPTLSRLPTSVADLVCVPLALVLLAYRRWTPTQNSGTARYSFARALHAVRDQFTIAYSHRNTVPEVGQWFADAGFETVREVALDAYPQSVRWNMWGNVGMYGDLPATAADGSLHPASER